MAEVRVIGGNRRPVQQVRVPATGWTKKRRTAFLTALAETCNVSLSAEMTGNKAHSAYALRRRDPAFAALWQDALETGYDRLETALLRRALIGVNEIDMAAVIDGDGVPVGQADRDGDGDGGVDGDGSPKPAFGYGPRKPGVRSDVAKLSAPEIQLALTLLGHHRAGVTGGRAAIGGKRRATQAETDAALTKKLDALARKLGTSV